MGLLDATTGLVEDLPYGSFAVALYASDMPDVGAVTDVEQILSWARSGAERLGLDEVHRRHSRWLSLNGQLIDRQITPERHHEAMAELWPDAERLERCIGYDIGRFLGDL